MLEPIEAYINKTECHYSDYAELISFLLYYNSECGNILFDEDKLFSILRYFKVCHSSNPNDINDYGKYFRENRDKLVSLEKQRQRYYKNADTLLPTYIESPTFLTASYNRLKRCISNKNQYIILKDTILCLSPVDTEHFINILLRKYTTTQIKQIISLIEEKQN